MKVDIKDTNGKPSKSVELSEDIFGLELNEHVLHLTTKGYMANLRQGTHQVKTKAMVSGGGKKPFKQKGTGNARQGSSRSPLHPGGGVAHGPVPRDYRQKMNRKLKNLALKVALSERVRFNKLSVMDAIVLDKFSTKTVLGLFEKLGCKKTLVIDTHENNFLYKSVRNLKNADMKLPSEVTVHDVLGHEDILITKNALQLLEQRLLKKTEN